MPAGCKKNMKIVCTTFVRKYTHARIGGHIRGRQERVSEKRGIRSKGGCSLRDKLYNLKEDKKKVSTNKKCEHITKATTKKSEQITKATTKASKMNVKATSGRRKWQYTDDTVEEKVSLYKDLW